MKKLLMMTVALAGMVLCGADKPADKGFMAGFNQADITPPLGTPISGYYSRRAATGVLDPLLTRCLALSDGTNRALVYSVDNLHITDDIIALIKSEITRKTGVPAGAIFIACTHTHTGAGTRAGGVSALPEDKPVVDFANQLLAARCADAGVRALQDLSAASLLIGRGEAKGISFVRRFLMKDGTTRTNPGANNPNINHALGEPDEQLQLVRFVRPGKKEIALVNFQCHPDVIGGTKFSGDWPGLSCRYLKDAMGGEIEVLFINGAQGDTNHCIVHPRPGHTAPKGYAHANHMARVVAGAALATWSTCVPVAAGKVQATVVGVKVRHNKGTPEQEVLAEKWVALHKAGKASEIPGVGMERTSNTAMAYRVLELKDKPDEIDLPVSVVSVGQSLVLGGFPGEPFTWMGTEMKRRSPFAMTIPACCCNGSRGYFPVKSAYGPGGYENATSRFAAGTAEGLVDGIVKQFEAFYAK